MAEFRIIGKSFPRFDGPVKAAGETRFLPDIEIPDCWVGGVVRSAVPRGRLRAVRVLDTFDWSRAVLVTKDDIPGENYIAIVRTD